jgi:general secretion pathway protein K
MSAHPHRRQRGVALIAVLWIVAALSVLVAGMVRVQRDEARVASAARQLVAGSALGQAATQLVLQEMASRAMPSPQLQRTVVRYAGLEIPVVVTPLKGLVDLNRAPEGLLAATFVIAGGVPADRAATLAAAVVQARGPAPGQASGPRFEAVEDLLQVPGVDYDLYARLLPLVTSDSSGSGRVNPLAAPESVLQVLAGGQAERAARIASRRDAGEPGVDTTQLTADFVDATAASTRFRLQARIPLADGRHLISSRLVDMGRTGADGVPWRIFHVDDRFLAPGADLK